MTEELLPAVPEGDVALPADDQARTSTPASPAADDPILAVTLRLARRLRAEYPDWVAAELTFGQLRLLWKLASHGPASMSSIAAWLGVGLPSVSGAVERLERHGLVERRHSSDDRRVVLVHLTDRGVQLQDEMAGGRLDLIRRALGVLEPTERDTLVHLLQTIADRMEGTQS